MTEETEHERIYQWLVAQKWRAIENEHKQALIEDQRKVNAGLFRSLPLNRRSTSLHRHQRNEHE